MPIETVYTRDEVHARWGISAEWLRRQAIARTIPFHRVAGRNMFTEADVAEILANTAVRPAQTAARAPRPPRARARAVSAVTP